MHKPIENAPILYSVHRVCEVRDLFLLHSVCSYFGWCTRGESTTFTMLAQNERNNKEIAIDTRYAGSFCTLSYSDFIECSCLLYSRSPFARYVLRVFAIAIVSIRFAFLSFSKLKFSLVRTLNNYFWFVRRSCAICCVIR